MQKYISLMQYFNKTNVNIIQVSCINLYIRNLSYFLYRSEDPHVDMVPTGTPREDDSYMYARSESFYYLFIIKIKCFDHIFILYSILIIQTHTHCCLVFQCIYGSSPSLQWGSCCLILCYLCSDLWTTVKFGALYFSFDHCIVSHFSINAHQFLL